MIITQNDRICLALNVLRPGAQYAITGNDVVALQWLDPVQTRPTDDEILAAIAAQQE
jgi:hypothetical protein